ncbi:hypothetical protein, partial [Sutterella wadsworthensis]|uniref:hypothetical protein n=1 Tax=Sutterella wadsworthensis TaxID=40545 RepID=UPI003A8E3CE0
LNIGIILAEKRNPVKTYWFIFTGLAQQNIRSLTLITRVRDLLSGSSGGQGVSFLSGFERVWYSLLRCASSIPRANRSALSLWVACNFICRRFST